MVSGSGFLILLDEGTSVMIGCSTKQVLASADASAFQGAALDYRVSTLKKSYREAGHDCITSSSKKGRKLQELGNFASSLDTVKSSRNRILRRIRDAIVAKPHQISHSRRCGFWGRCGGDEDVTVAVAKQGIPCRCDSEHST